MSSSVFKNRLLAATLASAIAGVASIPATAADSKADTAKVPQNDILNATLWMQNSVEYKATDLGLFALAKMRLDQALADKQWTALPDMQNKNYADDPVAIITDLDETMIDNNVYEASLITRGTNYSSKDWDKYVKDGVAKAEPGAVDFLKYAASRGVKVFYISNRNEDQEKATRANLEKLGFPMGGNVDTVLAKNEKPEWKSAKDNRHKVVARDYRVVLLMGDNLGDFTDKAGGTLEERHAAYRNDAKHWGHDWIMFPNPEYGSWESAAFGGDYSKPDDRKRKEKIDKLDTWSPSK